MTGNCEPLGRIAELVAGMVPTDVLEPGSWGLVQMLSEHPQGGRDGTGREDAYAKMKLTAMCTWSRVICCITGDSGRIGAELLDGMKGSVVHVVVESEPGEGAIGATGKLCRMVELSP